MARVKKQFHNIQCDCCGEIASEDWCCNEDDAVTMADDSGYITLGDRDYCPNCVTIDDDDNYITKDGRKYDGETHEEIDNSEKFVFEAIKKICRTDMPLKFAESNTTCFNVAQEAVRISIKAREGSNEGL